jgi:hypothetical protein
VRVFVDVTKDDAGALFLCDTGAASTHLMHALDGPRHTARAGTIRLGCEARVLDSSPQIPLDRFAGRDVIGILGADAVTSRLTELDLQAGTLRFHDRLPDDVVNWPAVPLELVNGVLLTRAKVDGRPARLLLDTGTDAVLLLTETPGLGQVVTTTDVFGNALHLVWSSAQLEWDRDEVRKVPAWRTRAHPAFERHARELGGADGILGLSAMGSRRLVFDLAHARLLVSPWLEPNR